MFGELVRDHRRRLGLTQEELADRTRVSVRTIGKIEAGRIATPRPTTLRMLADALELAGTERDHFCQAARTVATGPRDRATVPAQLPADLHTFTGRGAALAAMDNALATAADKQSTAVVISAISGTAGVGKTALAVHWAHRVRDRFPDGQLHVNLRGFDPTGTVMDPAEAIRRFLDALHVPPERIPADLDAQAALYRTLLADKRMLILLDNARDPDQVRPLLPGASSCLVLITSRNRLTGLVAAEAAHPLPLDLLTVDEARDLLTRRLGAIRVAAEPDAVSDIITACARLPLALAIFVANAATQPRLPLAALANQLRDTHARLDALSTSDAATTDLRAVFSWSYQALCEESARLFRLLGLHPGPDASICAIASLAGQKMDKTRLLLSELTAAHFITEHTPGRYTFHDLLRAYAQELVHRIDGDAERRTAIHRLLDHYVQTGRSAALQLRPHRNPIPLDEPLADVVVAGFGEHAAAKAWITAEFEVLLTVIEQAATHRFDTHTWQLTWNLADFFLWRGRLRESAASHGLALEAAQRQRHQRGEAYCHGGLAIANTELGRYDAARYHYERALARYRDMDEPEGEANIHHNLANLAERQGDYRSALYHAEQTLELRRAAGQEKARQANALNAIGWYRALLGDHQQALTYCQQALDIHQQVLDVNGEAATWDSLGYAHHHLGHHTEAIVSYQNALNLYRELGDRYNEAKTLTHLGDTHHTSGDPDLAGKAYRRAVTILDRLDHTDTENLRARLRARVRHPAEVESP